MVLMLLLDQLPRRRLRRTVTTRSSVRRPTSTCDTLRCRDQTRHASCAFTNRTFTSSLRSTWPEPRPCWTCPTTHATSQITGSSGRRFQHARSRRPSPNHCRTFASKKDKLSSRSQSLVNVDLHSNDCYSHSVDTCLQNCFFVFPTFVVHLLYFSIVFLQKFCEQCRKLPLKWCSRNWIAVKEDEINCLLWL